ncbi:MAG: V-type ATP synthase subunit B, partial [Planctomycetota bacterium]
MTFKEYLTVKDVFGIKDVFGPLVIVEGVEGVTYGELTEVRLPTGDIRRGRVLEISDSAVLVQVFEGTLGIGRDNVRVRFLGKGQEIQVCRDML